MNAILGFKDEYRFLSNFYLSPITINGLIFQTVEHYFQAMKMTNHENYIKIHQCPTPGEAKKLARTLPIRQDWSAVKNQIMEYALYQKFNIPNLQLKLLETGDSQLIEINNWNDTYWGVDIKTNQGQNILGKLLMKIRDYYINLNEIGRYHNPDIIHKSIYSTNHT